MEQADKELKRIIREAEKVLKQQGQFKSAAKMNGVPKEVMKAAKLFNRYKELSGKKRLSDVEKRALLKYTPKQVLKAQNLSQKIYEKRLAAFRELVGRDINPAEYVDLRYLTPKQTVKRYEIEKTEEKTTEDQSSEATEEFPDLFTSVQLPSFRWWDIPSIIRSSAEERRSGGFLYENTGIFWDNPEKISMSRLLYSGVDGRQFIVIMGVRTILYANGRRDILIDPDNSGSRIAVYREEWESVEELSPDWKESRKYRKKQ